MTIKKLSRPVLIILLIAVLLLLTFKIRNKISNLKDQVERITTAHNQLADENGGLQTLVTRYGDSLQMVNQIILSQKQAIEMGLLNQKELKDKYLKEVSNVVKLSEEIQILNKRGTWVDTIHIRKIEDADWLKIPAQMNFGDEWYQADITVFQVPILNSLVVYSQPTLTIGTIKHGLFKKPEKVTIYENDNPYIKLKSSESLTIKEQDKWYQKTWFKVGAGFIGGVLLTGAIQ